MAKRRNQIIRQEKRRQSHKILDRAEIPRRQHGNRLGAKTRIAIAKKQIRTEAADAAR